MIKRIQIENFKSFGKVDLEPHSKVNLLIGPNSSGKSNFLEALQLGQKKPATLEFLQENFLKLSDKVNRIQSNSGFEIKLEFMPVSGVFDLLKFSYESESLLVELKNSKGFAQSTYNFEKYKDPVRHFSGLGHEEELELDSRRFFGGIQKSGIVKYVPNVDKMRAGVVLLPNFKRISSDLSDIALLINHLNQNYRSTFYQKLLEDLKNITGEFDLITTPPSQNPGEIEMRFFAGDVGFSPWEVSDGILLFTAILAILHQPNPPKVILLEEPENGIHPRRIIEIYRLITKLAEEKEVQFFITTHSPILLNQFSESPECVWVFDKVDGISQIKNLKKDILDPRTQQLIEMGVENPGDLTDDLGENWMLGLIDGVPPSVIPEDF